MRTILNLLAISVSISLPLASLDEANSETVADYWFRTHVVHQDPNSNALVVDEQACNDNQGELGFLWDNISQKLMSPFKTLIHYVDHYKTRIGWVETCANGSDGCYQTVSSSNDYIKTSLPEIESTLKEGYHPTTLSFAETQRLPFIKRQTLAGEEVRLCGIDQEIETMILLNLFGHLRLHELMPLHLYYFGSRVMPRSEVIKRDQQVASTMPVNDDGVVKNAVRIKGLTHISDLEMMVLVYAPAERTEKELKKVSYDFKRKFSRVFRDFPVSVKLIFVKDPTKLPADPFDFINQIYGETRNKQMSRYQYVKI